MFVAGANLEIHIRDRALLWPRVTSDVDVVADAAPRSRYDVPGEAEEVADGDDSDRLVSGAEDERLPAALD